MDLHMAREGQQAFTNLDLRAEATEARKPSVRFAFEFPELLAEFEPLDAIAGRARKASRSIGFWAIGLVLAALLLASADPALALLGHEAHEALGYVAAGLGLLGTLLGLWTRSKSSARTAWLQARMQTELLRLFHFRYLANRLTDVAAASGNSSAEKAYVEARLAAFGKFKQAVLDRPDRVYADLLSDSDHAPLDGLIEPQQTERQPMSPSAEDAFAAWRKLRLEWQLGYADAKLANAAPGGRPTPRRQEEIFLVIGWSCIAVIVLLHVVHFGEGLLHLPRLWLQIGVVWTALIALAARALESGLAPQREVERYEHYRANIRVAMKRFDAADGFAAKLEAMRAFEQLGFEEMLVFIRTHAKSHFLL